jgi:hypothetical protein
MLRSTFFLLLTLVLFSSCDDDDPVILGEYQNGVFVINEGNFGNSNGAVTFFSRATSEVEQTVFQNVNQVNSLGDVVQSAEVFDNKLFIVVNNSNKVEVVNVNTMELLYTISDVSLPRYVDFEGGKGYLTEWVSFTEPGRITVFDPDNGTIERRIEVGFGAEDIEIIDNTAYVTNSFSNTLSVVNLSDGSNEEITLSTGPGQLVFDTNDNLWIIARGGFDSQTFEPLNDGAIHRFNTNSNVLEVSVNLNTNAEPRLAINNTGTNVYFFLGNEVFEIDVNVNSLPSNPIIALENAQSIYGIGVDPVTNQIFIGDSKFFLDDGEVFRYDASGTMLGSFRSGIGPNGFAFN